ncbi:SNF-related serine/threonine-protein kinase-like [Rhinatrema bivittatum]|uniref:SNF-related serine/threonine-protein kinase-like n=1 Tax=Rhinatrema bivittatum TaxID=194408 RepID=UPI00112D5F82|nr:SNF-related serine/threonine-protein kinase-like [Rhinatrema bivittatum]XP_029464730.1 SNF-related serine/threonine-protein kinase-like [Rhinatrema bivittatum]
MAGTRSSYEGKIAGLYDLERTLGKGHFAVVKLARHVFTGEKVAVKVIDKTKLDQAAAGHLLQEVRCMKLVQHPNVVRLYEVIDTQTKLYLILELGDGGDMFDHIMKHDGGLSEAQAKHYFAQIVHAISYCHKLHVVHRDLKPENVVFFREQGVVKLTDFGFSNRFQPGTMLTTSCGSLAYSAPEILLGDEYDAPAVDIWSLGVILYMLMCGHPPFQEANDSETLTMILDCRYTVPPRMAPECADLIARMLQRDPLQRASLEEIESHPWLQGVDPSPASRSLLPLTSYKRVSEEEHETIIQAMTCGGIADRESIQEALEADQYNHITATYFLLAERILREKQEKQNQTINLVYSWADPLESRSPVPESLAAGTNTEVRSTLLVMPGELAAFSVLQCASRAAAEDSAKSSPEGRKFVSLPLVGEEDALPGSHGPGQPTRVLLRPSVAEAPVAKSAPALQRICEEEEEENEQEKGKADTTGDLIISQNQGPSRDLQSARASRDSVVKVQDGGARQGASEHVAEAKCNLEAAGGQANQNKVGPSHKEATSKTSDAERTSIRKPSDIRVRDTKMSIGKDALGKQVSCGTVEKGGGGKKFRRCCAEAENVVAVLEECELENGSGREDNNNTTKLVENAVEKLSKSGSHLQHTKSKASVIDCVMGHGVQGREDIQGNSADASALEERSRTSRGTSETGASKRPKYPADKIDKGFHEGGMTGIESTVDPVIKLDPAKNKSGNLKDRILQFPLCEKALAFRIKPSSKENLLSLGQFNCCHVI